VNAQDQGAVWLGKSSKSLDRSSKRKVVTILFLSEEGAGEELCNIGFETGTVSKASGESVQLGLGFAEIDEVVFEVGGDEKGSDGREGKTLGRKLGAPWKVVKRLSLA
jgi:hypothetical protein